MGVNLKSIVPHKPLDFDDLRGKTLAVDAMNTLYQFMASIRQPDGTPLMDRSGNITSHLAGLLYRTANIVKLGIKPVYVFDGPPHPMKKRELDRRKKAKEEARREWEQALKEGRLEDAKKYAQRTSRFTPEMLEDAKRLLTHMGVPYITAPGEGEAQCAHLCGKGEVWAVSSQDYDCLLFGAPKLVRGLSISGDVRLELMELSEVLDNLGLSREQLIDLAILVGTDFNEGVYGIGPKKGLKAVAENRIMELELSFNLDEARSVFLNHPVTDDYELGFKSVDEDALVSLLTGEHSFSEDRVKRTAKVLRDAYGQFSQQSITKWFQ